MKQVVRDIMSFGAQFYQVVAIVASAQTSWNDMMLLDVSDENFTLIFLNKFLV